MKDIQWVRHFSNYREALPG